MKTQPLGLRVRLVAMGLSLSSTAGLWGCGTDSQAALATATLYRALSPDGDFVVATGVQKTVNTYAALAADAQSGQAAVLVSPSDFATLGVQPGDLVMIYQAQGAQIATPDSADYGQVTNLGGAGLYELACVTTADPASGQIQLNMHRGGLRNAYSAAGKTQVIRVPQYSRVAVASGGTIDAKPWDGSTGGVIVLRTEELELDGTLTTSGSGFRGGRFNVGTGLVNVDQIEYRSPLAVVGGEKGEGIAGAPADYDLLGGRWGRGAPANGGGGGNNTNSGGGGGANAGDIYTYTGDGVMGDPATYGTPWRLDPYYAANGTFASSPGGGRGAYTYASSRDPTRYAPGDPIWSGNNHREHGGRGGHPLAPAVSTRLFLGGGGGGGEANNNVGTPGAPGGGVIMVFAQRVTATASGLLAADGRSASPASFDGAGGGGGGGSVVLWAPQVSGVQLSARGGDGGGITIPVYGSGGGGGGGFVAHTQDTSVSPQVSGGSAGRVSAPALAAFPMNGATDGGNGIVEPSEAIPPLPSCQLADLSAHFDLPPAQVRIEESVELRVVVSNAGPQDAEYVTLTMPLPQGATVKSPPDGETWTCTGAAAVYTCTLASLPAGTAAPLVGFRLAAVSDAPRQLQLSAQVSAMNPDLVPGNNRDDILLSVASQRVHGGGLGCRMTGQSAPSHAFWFLFGLVSLVSVMRRRGRRRVPT